MSDATVENEDLLRAYRATFMSPHGQLVFDDLMKFCRFRREVESPIEEGHRRVFLRIMNFLNLTPEQLSALYGGRPILNSGAEDETAR